MTTGPENQTTNPYGSPHPPHAPHPQYGAHEDLQAPQGVYQGQQVPGPAPTTPYGAGPHASPFAHWGQRVAAYILDALLYSLVPFILAMFAVATSTTTTDAFGNVETIPNGAGVTALVIAFVVYVGVWIWNRVIRQGGTGQSVGKQMLKIRLVSATTGQPVGAGTAFLREICHVLDGFFYLGYLWPLWDTERQTFADKIVSTYVVKV